MEDELRALAEVADQLDDDAVLLSNWQLPRQALCMYAWAAQRLGRRGQDLVAPPLASIRRIAAKIRLVAAACDLPRLDRRIMARRRADHITFHLIGIGREFREPCARGVEPRDGAVDAGIAVRMEAGRTGRRATEARAVQNLFLAAQK